MAETPQKGCYEIALVLLGRRDFSCAELNRKLQDKGFTAQEAAAAIARLLDLGYLDDARYAQAVVRTRAKLSGWGKVRIRQDLIKRMLPKPLIEEALADWEDAGEKGDEPDWATKAAELLERKFGRWHGRLEEKDYAKRLGFLMRRGFAIDQARRALDLTKDEL